MGLEAQKWAAGPHNMGPAEHHAKFTEAHSCYSSAACRQRCAGGRWPARCFVCRSNDPISDSLNFSRELSVQLHLAKKEKQNAVSRGSERQNTIPSTAMASNEFKLQSQIRNWQSCWYKSKRLASRLTWCDSKKTQHSRASLRQCVTVGDAVFFYKKTVGDADHDAVMNHFYTLTTRTYRYSTRISITTTQITTG